MQEVGPPQTDDVGVEAWEVLSPKSDEEVLSEAAGAGLLLSEAAGGGLLLSETQAVAAATAAAAVSPVVLVPVVLSVVVRAVLSALAVAVVVRLLAQEQLVVVLWEGRVVVAAGQYRKWRHVPKKLVG